MVPETETKAAQVDLKKEECEEELILPKAEPIVEPQEITAEEPSLKLGFQPNQNLCFKVEPVKEKSSSCSTCCGGRRNIEEIVEVQAR